MTVPCVGHDVCGSLDRSPARLESSPRPGVHVAPDSDEGDQRWRIPRPPPRGSRQPAAVAARAADGRRRCRCWREARRLRQQLELVEHRRRHRHRHAQAGGNFRLGVTGGGSKDIIDGQTSSPSPTRRACWRLGDAAHLRRELQAARPTASPRRSRRTSPTSGRSRSSTASSSTTARRSTADDVDLLAAADPQPQARAVRHRRPRLGRPQRHQEDGQTTVRLELKPPDSASATSSASTTTASCPSGYEADTGAQAGRHRPVHRCRASRRASRASTRSNPELLAHRPAVLRPGHDHRLHRPDGAGQRAARRARSTP